jgi:hypothetical protein
MRLGGVGLLQKADARFGEMFKSHVLKAMFLCRN